MLDPLIMTWDSTAHLASLRFCWFLECDMNALFPSWGLHRCSYDWRYLLPAHGRQLHGLMYGTFPYMQVTMYFCNWWWMIRENRRYSLTHASIKPITRRIAESNKFSVICRTRYCHFSLWLLKRSKINRYASETKKRSWHKHANQHQDISSKLAFCFQVQ